MNIQLHTDFHDYYDHMFDLDGEVFSRISRDTKTRRENFLLLESMGLPTPQHGELGEFIGWVRPSGIVLDRIILYTDPYAHAGEGKVLTTKGAAFDKYPSNTYISEMVEGCYPIECTINPRHGVHRSLSLRYLKVGRRTFWLEYWSDTDWRSNCGEGGVEVICEESPRYSLRDLPLFAIDFVISRYRWQSPIALDFNSAPGLGGTGIQDILTPTQVVDLIKDSKDYSKHA